MNMKRLMKQIEGKKWSRKAVELFYITGPKVNLISNA